MKRDDFQIWRDTMDQRGVKIGTDSTLYVDHAEDGSIDDGDEVVICSVCGQGLNRFTVGGVDESWVHARAWQQYDHEPIPQTAPKSVERDQVCDFCATNTRLYWSFTGDRLRHGTGNTVHDYGTSWGACQDCATIIRDGDLDQLADRVMRISGLGRDMPPAETANMRSQLTNMWTTFLTSVHTQTYVGPKREPAKLNPRLMPKLQLGLIKFWNHSGLLDQFSDGRKATGQTHSIPGLHSGQEEQFTVRYGPDEPMPPAVWRNHVQHLAAGIYTADLYWISSDFTQLATMAGKDFDKLIISREELPSPFGFLVFEQPIGEIARPGGAAAIRAISWTLVPGGIWLNLYIQGEDADPDVDVEEMRAELGYLLCPNPGTGWAFDTEISAPAPTDAQYTFINTIFAAWFLMTQPGVADSNPAPVDKKAARAYQRQYNRRQPDVKLVDLRRQPHRVATEAENAREGRKLSVRVYRRGHWKRQAYGPKHGMRKTIYVSAYIAGPEGAPLKERPATVKVLR